MIKRYTETWEDIEMTERIVEESPAGEYVRIEDIKAFILALIAGPLPYELEYQEAVQELSHLIGG